MSYSEASSFGVGSALSLLRSRLSVDIDQLSPELAERYGPFCDMTSNPAVLAMLIASDTHVDLVRRVVARAKLETGGDLDEAVDLALDLMVVSLSKAILPFLTGRVHAQVSPRHALSTSDTLIHATRLMRLFAQEGISPGRVCLQIPCTGAGIAAAAVLEKSGVRTSATTVFSVDQARAAASAGCLYVAPYWHEFAVQFQPADWEAYDDPAKEHPMAGVVKEIVDIYAKWGAERIPQVLVMNMVTPADALAVSTLGVDHVSLSGDVIEALAGGVDEATFRSSEHVEPDENRERSEGVELRGVSGKGKGSVPSIDWLADEGAAVDESIRSDESVSRRLEFAIRSFEECEARVAHVIRQLMTI